MTLIGQPNRASEETVAGKFPESQHFVVASSNIAGKANRLIF
jgi:hypothetical protein